MKSLELRLTKFWVSVPLVAGTMKTIAFVLFLLSGSAFAETNLVISRLSNTSKEPTVFAVPELQIGTNIYRDAEIRKAGPGSAIVRHSDGFFSIAITNLPLTVQANLLPPALLVPPKYVVPKEVKDYLAANRNINGQYAIMLEEGRITLDEVKARVAEDLKREQAESNSGLLAQSERALRNNNVPEAARLMTVIVHDFQGSHAASIIMPLIRIARQEGAEPYRGSITSCSVADAQSIKNSFNSMETIARNYNSTSREKREALDAIFGPGAFSTAKLNLEQALRCLTHLELSRQKALHGE